MSVVLLVETAQGGNLAVRFPDGESARAWEDQHPEISALGLAELVSRAEALRLS